MKLLIFSIISFFGLAACSLVSTPVPTPTPELISECFLHREVFVWVDTNGDGTHDADEEPLRGVSAAIVSTGSNRSFIGQTGQDGIADINGIGDFGRFCDELEAEITVPPGYEPSTPTLISLAGLTPGDPLMFGLVPSASE